MRLKRIITVIGMAVVACFVFLFILGSYVSASTYDVTLPNTAFWVSALGAIAAVLIILGPMYLMRWRQRMRAAKAATKVDTAAKEDHFDHVAWARALLAKARDTFDEGNQKDAHALVAEALRLFYVHELGLDGELPSTQLVAALKEQGLETSAVEWCLERCTLVEFARAKPKDFEQLVTDAEHIVGGADLSKL